MLRSADLLTGTTRAEAPPAGGAALQMPIGALTLLLALAVLAIVAASFSAMATVIAAGWTRDEIPQIIDHLSKLTKFLLKFDTGGEQTVAAWFSSILLFSCSMTLFYIATMKRHLEHKYAVHWLCLSFIFFALSMDESVGFHEMTVKPMRELFGASGVFLYAWVIPAGAFVAIVGLAYLGFLLHLPWATRWRVLLAGVLFVGGALGFEMLEGEFVDIYFQHPLLREIMVHVEDALEFAGELLFLHTLLRYAQRHLGDLAIRLR